MNIPKYLNLEPRQIDKLNKWLARIKKPTLEQVEEMYGGASITSPIKFIIQPDSFCDSIKAVSEFAKSECDLTIDDNNEIEPLWPIFIKTKTGRYGIAYGSDYLYFRAISVKQSYNVWYHSGIKISSTIIRIKDCTEVSKQTFIRHIKESGLTLWYDFNPVKEFLS